MNPPFSTRHDALDGLRTLAVLAVVVFHLAVPGAAAGYLGVDIFFVLSGFLITTQLAAEVSSTGRIDALRFWGRRLRRLLPAVLIVLLAVTGYAWLARPYRRPSLGGDIVSSTLYYSNWHFIDAGLYFATEASPSPLHHMWSLSLEEQFYLAWPIAVIGAALLGRAMHLQRKHLLRLVVAICVVLLAASLATMLWQAHHPARPDRPYMGTDAKAFEPLLGALLALLMALPLPHTLLMRWGRTVGWLGLVGVAAGLLLLDSKYHYFNGGAFLFSAASAALIVGLVSGPKFWPNRLFALGPVAYLGRISYGIYLWHWPWALLLDAHASFRPARAALVIAATIACAALSYHLVEQPIRHGRVLGWRGTREIFISAATGMASVLVLAAPLGGSPASPLAAAVLPTPERSPQTVMMVGDSVPYHLLPALDRAGQAQQLTVLDATMRGCSPLGVAIHSSPTDVLGAKCVGASRRQSQRIVERNPGLVIWWSRYEIADRYRQGRLLDAGTDEFWEAQLEDFRRSVDRLTSRGATVVIVLTERPGTGIAKSCTSTSCHPMIRRMIDRGELRERWNELVVAEAKQDHRIRTITLEDKLCPNGIAAASGPTQWLCDDTVQTGVLSRPDGTHVALGDGIADGIASTLLIRAAAAGR